MSVQPLRSSHDHGKSKRSHGSASAAGQTKMFGYDLKVICRLIAIIHDQVRSRNTTISINWHQVSAECKRLKLGNSLTPNICQQLWRWMAYSVEFQSPSCRFPRGRLAKREVDPGDSDVDTPEDVPRMKERSDLEDLAEAYFKRNKATARAKSRSSTASKTAQPPKKAALQQKKQPPPPVPAVDWHDKDDQTLLLAIATLGLRWKCVQDADEALRKYPTSVLADRWETIKSELIKQGQKDLIQRLIGNDSAPADQAAPETKSKSKAKPKLKANKKKRGTDPSSNRETSPKKVKLSPTLQKPGPMSNQAPNATQL